MHIFFVATSPLQGTGYARIGHRITAYLASRGHTIDYFAFQQIEVGTIKDRTLHSNITLIDVERLKKVPEDTFGGTIIVDALLKSQPDLVVVYNDMVVTSKLLHLVETQIPKSQRTWKTVSYLDLVYDYQDMDMIKHVDEYTDHIFVFTQHWKDHLEHLGVRPDKISLFPHGIDTDIFTPLSLKTARGRFGLADDAFVVLNTNRNSYRKGLDLTISAFLKFWKLVGCPDHVKLMLNCHWIPEGYDIIHTVRKECLRQQLDVSQALNHQILRPGNNGLLSDADLNALYNACDVGLNTCVGEGFGLCNLEHAGLGKPQIVSNVGGLSDIFGPLHDKNMTLGVAVVDPVASLTLVRAIDAHVGDIYICDPDEFAAYLTDIYYKLVDMPPENRSHHSLRAHILHTYNWPSLLESFHTRLLSI